MSIAESNETVGTEASGEDSLRRYLDEIGRYPLLTRSQEVQLAKRVAAGDKEARRRLVESNLRLVVTIARGYHRAGFDLLDLIQEGTLGLMRAAERYDWRRDVKFSTYAAWWIRHAVVQSLSSASAIRLPESVQSRVADVQRTERSLAAELCRRPTVAEITEELELTVGQVLEAQAAAQPVGSLDESIRSDGERGLAEVIADPHAPDPLQTLVDEAPGYDLESSLARLPDRSRTVIELRFGLRDGIARTADSVAQELGVARERVRQIELQTLRRLAADAGSMQQAA
jgi:RNA polymerase primary sigma factor